MKNIKFYKEQRDKLFQELLSTNRIMSRMRNEINRLEKEVEELHQENVDLRHNDTRNNVDTIDNV